MDFGMRALTVDEEKEEEVALILLDFSHKASLLPSALKICDSTNKKKRILRKRTRDQIPSEAVGDFPVLLKWTAKCRRTMMPSNGRRSPAVVAFSAAAAAAAAAAPALTALPNVVSHNEKPSSIDHTELQQLGLAVIQKDQAVAPDKKSDVNEDLLSNMTSQCNKLPENQICQEEQLCEELSQLSKKRKILANAMNDALRFCEQVSTYYEQLHQKETEVESKLLLIEATRHGAVCC